MKDNELSGTIVFATRDITELTSLQNYLDYRKIIFPNLFVFLLADDGKFHDASDLLYYNSSNKILIEVRGGQGSTPISMDEAIIGPMSSEDFGCCFRMNIGLNYLQPAQCCMIQLDKVSSNINAIVFAHVNYHFTNEELPNDLKVTLLKQNDIIAIKDKKEKPFEKVTRMGVIVDAEPRGIQIVKDIYETDLSHCAHFVSSVLRRNDDGTWKYIHSLLYYNNAQEIIDNYKGIELQ